MNENSKIWIFILITGLLLSCKQKQTNCYQLERSLALKRIMVTEFKGAYNHEISISNYCDDCFSEFDLAQLAYNYLDTVKQYKPIYCIAFCKPIEKYPYYGDSQDGDVFRQHSIIWFYFCKDCLSEKYPTITSIVFWKEGKPQNINLCPIKDNKCKCYEIH